MRRALVHGAASCKGSSHPMAPTAIQGPRAKDICFWQPQDHGDILVSGNADVDNFCSAVAWTNCSSLPVYRLHTIAVRGSTSFTCTTLMEGWKSTRGALQSHFKRHFNSSIETTPTEHTLAGDVKKSIENCYCSTIGQISGEVAAVALIVQLCSINSFNDC